jgi:hypothetical protein
MVSDHAGINSEGNFAQHVPFLSIIEQSSAVAKLTQTPAIGGGILKTPIFYLPPAATVLSQQCPVYVVVIYID